MITIAFTSDLANLSMTYAAIYTSAAAAATATSHKPLRSFQQLPPAASACHPLSASAAAAAAAAAAGEMTHHMRAMTTMLLLGLDEKLRTIVAPPLKKSKNFITENQ